MLNLSELRSQDAAPDVASPERAPFAQYVVIPYSWLGVLDAIAGRHAHRLMLRLMWISWRQKEPDRQADKQGARLSNGPAHQISDITSFGAGRSDFSAMASAEITAGYYPVPERSSRRAILAISIQDRLAV